MASESEVVPSYKRTKVSLEKLVHPMYPERCKVTESDWSKPDAGYTPTEFTHPKIVKSSGNKGFDPLRLSEALKAELKQRPSCFPRVTFDPETGRPLNPLGRTGLQGRGLLRQWGPNQAGDALVMRKCSHAADKFEFVAIRRKDNGEWALPGGRIEPDEDVVECIRREFEEEACAFGEEEMPATRELLDEIFEQGSIVYHGVVLDPRTTDNCWMETRCYLVYVHDPKKAEQLRVRGGDDAVEAKWIVASPEASELKSFYANHAEIVFEALKKLK